MSQNRVPALVRFEIKFQKREKGCWEWEAASNEGGYGYFYIAEHGGVIHAHRASWLLYRGAIPDGQQVLHECDNKLCVNPEHLFLGTQLVNMQDKVAKGRQAKGETHGRAKLTVQRVREIKTGRANGIATTLLARLYAIDRTTIHSICTGKTWLNAAGLLEGEELEAIMAIFRFQQEEWEKERSEKARQGQAKTVEILRARTKGRTTRVCGGECGRELPNDSEHFYVKDKKKGQLLSRCKQCHNKVTLARYHGPKHEEIKEKNRLNMQEKSDRKADDRADVEVAVDVVTEEIS